MPSATAPRRRVLLIDDSEPIHRLADRWLRPEDVELTFATDAEAGFKAALTSQPDLILLDVNLPGGGGLDLCRRLKSEAELMSVPILLLTGATSAEERLRGLDLGAVDHVIKPIDPAEFRARVRAALRTKHLTDLLANNAQIDGLTGLRNRRYLDEQLNVARATLRRTGRPFGLLLVGLDHFQAVNDAHGHPFGDEVLRRAAGAIAAACREEDVVCRHGGDGFAVLTPGVGLPGVATLGHRIAESVAALCCASRSTTVRITASLGTADATTDAAAESVLNRTAAALAAAKLNGRNRLEMAAAVIREAA